MSIVSLSLAAGERAEANEDCEMSCRRRGGAGRRGEEEEGRGRGGAPGAAALQLGRAEAELQLLTETKC